MSDFPWHAYGWRGIKNRLWKALGGDVEIVVDLKPMGRMVRGFSITPVARPFVKRIYERTQEAPDVE